ncbi:zinc transporter ZIP3-like [Panonychus citri]|uniref:zinc transporter ZIP3-like n=1 Tax=Panonychus citri TaxID=50023 RepID=UPI00230768C6|nr:zinc transporter ZIP3-like [Panonychus citri]
MAVGEARVVALFALFGVTMLAGFGPVFGFSLWKKKQESNLLDSQDERRKQKARNDKILHLLLVFGGGVLLATCFVHMIPEIQENYDKYMAAHKHSDDKPTTISPINLSEGMIYQHPTHSENGDDKDDDDDDDDDGAPWVEICICIGIFLTYAIEESVVLLIGRDSHNHNISLNITKRENEDNLGNNGVTLNVGHAESNSNNFANSIKFEGVWTRFLRGLIIVVAFLAHAVFDGIAIGLQSTTTSVWTIFFAICLHKLVVVFAIGFELFEKTGSLLLTAIHVAIFSAMSPIGIVLSIIIEDGLTEDGSLTLILLNAVATGAILYIVFLEILQADRCREVNGLYQLAALILGFILMTLMTTLVSDGD